MALNFLNNGSFTGTLATTGVISALGGNSTQWNAIATGLDFGMSVQKIKRLIRGAGFVPAQRNTLYDMIRTFDQDQDVVTSEASCS